MKQEEQDKLIAEACKIENLGIQDAVYLRELIRLRFPDEQFVGYICEWARRIKSGYAYQSADHMTARVLEKIGYPKKVEE